MESELSPQPGFWEFSIDFYSEPAVGKVCIELQDEKGVDVNVLLFLIWCAARRKSFSLDQVAEIAGSAAEWQSGVVKPLRSARRFLKERADRVEAGAAVELREEIKKLELESERGT